MFLFILSATFKALDNKVVNPHYLLHTYHNIGNVWDPIKYSAYYRYLKVLF